MATGTTDLCQPETAAITLPILPAAALLPPTVSSCIPPPAAPPPDHPADQYTSTHTHAALTVNSTDHADH